MVKNIDLMPYSKEEETELIRLWKGGMTAPKIAKILGKTTDSVNHKLRRLGLLRGRRHTIWTQEEIAQAFTLRKRGIPMTAIAKALGKPYQSVTWMFYQAELPARWQGKDAEDEGIGLLSRDYEIIQKGTYSTPYDVIIRDAGNIFAVQITRAVTIRLNVDGLRKFGIPAVLWKSNNDWYLFKLDKHYGPSVEK
jgi:DNA-binding CsgD family transcriptional regulator